MILTFLLFAKIYFQLFQLFITVINSKKYKTELEKILREKQPVCTGDLALNGNDLKEIGITGVKTGQILEMLLEKVWENPGVNTKDKLFELIKEELRG